MSDNRRSRLTALRAQLTEARMDALLVTSLPNVRYLTGFSGSSGVVIVSRDDVVLVTDFRYKTQVEEEVGAAARCVIDPQNLWNSLWKQLARLNAVRVVGFEVAHVSVKDSHRLSDEGSRWEWRQTEDIVEGLRERKDKDEVEAIGKACDIAIAALDQMLSRIKPGVTELALAGELEKLLREAGSEAHPFAAIVASGPRTALPHARSSERVVERGDLVLLDFGATWRGYCSDITRTFVAGRAAPRAREVHKVVRGANELARSGVKVGMRGRDADALAREYIDRAGFGEQFGHGLGHGLGLEVHEAPRLSRISDGLLAPGAVVTIEPGIYIPGWGGIRIEDDVHLSNDGPRLLTNFTRELLELQ